MSFSGIVFIMHEKVKTITFRCWMKPFWHPKNPLWIFMILSGIFSNKDEKLDILPPPPPFPKLGINAGEEKAAGKSGKEKLSEKEENKKIIEEQKSRQEELRKQKERKSSEEKNRLEEKDKQEIKEQQKKERKEKFFTLLHSFGLVKTEEEKKKLEEQKRLWKQEKLRRKLDYEQEKIRIRKEKEKQKLLEENRRKLLEEKKRLEEKAKEEQRIRGIEKEKKDLKIKEQQGKKEALKKRKEKELEEKNRKQVLEQRKRERKEKLFSLLHEFGLVRTEEEKKELQRKKETYWRLKFEAKKAKEELRRKSELKKVDLQDLSREISELGGKNHGGKTSQRRHEAKESKKKPEKEPNRNLTSQETKNKKEPLYAKTDLFEKSKSTSLQKSGKENLSIKEQFLGLFPKFGLGTKKENKYPEPAIAAKEISTQKKHKSGRVAKIKPQQHLPDVKEDTKQKKGLNNFFSEILGRKKEISEELELQRTQTEEVRAISELAGSKTATTEKSGEVIEAEEEIQKAIESLKIKKKPKFAIFTKKQKAKIAQEKIEMPQVMPRTYDKIDYVEIVEAKIHKARMALMDFDFARSRRIYIEIMEAYNRMESKDKQDVYEDIKDLYYERKNAEKFAGQ